MTALRVVHDCEPPLERGSGWAWVPVRRDVSLIDLVAALVGEPGADCPRGVHPTLVAVGRAVSELSSPAGRRELRPLALSFPETAHPGWLTPARLVERCASTALARREQLDPREVRRLEAARRLAGSLLGKSDEAGQASVRWALRAARVLRLDEPLYRCFVACAQAAEAVGLAARGGGSDRDRRLRELLMECIDDVRSGATVQPVNTAYNFSKFSARPTRHRQSGPVGM